MSKKLTELKMALALIETTVKTLPRIEDDVVFNMLESVRDHFDVAIPNWIKLEAKSPTAEDTPLVARPLADILKAHGSPYSERTFIRKAIKAGILVQKPWPHETKPGKFRNRLMLTARGALYGEVPETGVQPHWYNKSFIELLEILQ